MKTIRTYLLLVLLTFGQNVVAQVSQEENLIRLLKGLDSVSQFDDSILFVQKMNLLKEEIISTLENDHLMSFETFRSVADSLDFYYELGHSGLEMYELFTFRYNNQNWNYVLRNNAILLSEEDVFHKFHELFELKPNELLLITEMDEMSYSCYEAFIIKQGENTTKNTVLTVCSFTKVSEIGVMPSDSSTDEPIMVGKVHHPDPIQIQFDQEKKTISYCFIRFEDEKTMCRKANYRNGTFKIESYDAQTEFE